MNKSMHLEFHKHNN